MYRVLFLAIALACLVVAPVHGQTVGATSDTTLVKEALDDYDKRLRYTVLVDPFALYSRTFGFGIAGQVSVYNFLWTGSRWRAYARPAQRRGLYRLSLRTNDPKETNVYGLLSGTYETNGAYRYYGVGQSTLFDNLIMVDKDYVEAVGRLGFEFVDDHLTIQPMVGYLWNKAGLDFEPDTSAVFANLDERSQQELLYAIGDSSSAYPDASNVHQGVRFGIQAALDYRGRRAYPLSGVLLQAGWERYQSITDQDVVFDRLHGDAAAFLRITSSHVLALRAKVQTTSNQGESPIPFYLYPKLDFNKLGGYRNQRHIDYDLFNVTAEYRWPLINLVDLYQVSSFVQTGLGGVYDDIWNDFDLSVTFKKDLEDGTNPLRPGFGIGLRVSGLEQQVDYIQWLLGVGPEGFTLMTFKFVVEIGEIR